MGTVLPVVAQDRGAALEFLRERFGGFLEVRDKTITSAAAVTELVGASIERVSLTIVNMGAGVLLVTPNHEGDGTYGIRCNSLGGGISLNINDDSLLPCQQWYGYTTNVGDVFYVLEVLRYARAKSGG